MHSMHTGYTPKPRRARARRRRARAGLTLVETLVSLGITGVVLAAGANLLMQSVRSQATFQQTMSAAQNARASVDMIADDMKGAVKFTSLVTVGALQKSLPNQTVQNASTGDISDVNLPNEDDYTHPVTFDIYADNGGLRRVRYWRRFDATLQTYVVRREVVNDSLVSSVRTAPESASGPDAGRIVARNVERFTVQKPYDTASATSSTRFDLVRITLSTMEGAADAITKAKTTHAYQAVSRATVQADVNLRNNAL